MGRTVATGPKRQEREGSSSKKSTAKNKEKTQKTNGIDDDDDEPTHARPLLSRLNRTTDGRTNGPTNEQDRQNAN